MIEIEREFMNTAEKQLDEIRKLLFPKSVQHTDVDEKGEDVTYYIDYSADLNLEAALSDIQEGYSDSTVRNTILDVIDRLSKIRELLDEHLMFTKDVNYFVVENLRKDSVEDIE